MEVGGGSPQEEERSDSLWAPLETPSPCPLAGSTQAGQSLGGRSPWKRGFRAASMAARVLGPHLGFLSAGAGAAL